MNILTMTTKKKLKEVATVKMTHLLKIPLLKQRELLYSPETF